MLPLLPYKQFVVDSAYSPEQLQSLLAQAVMPRRSWAERFRPAAKPFEGEITVDGFRISRSISYRNSVLPVITGRFSASARGTRIEIRMSLHPVVVLFAFVWLSGVGSCALISVGSWFTGDFETVSLIPPVMLVFFYLMVMGGFWWEANQAEPLLIRLFSARPPLNQ
ncbi:MAG TPA: hypothetical protein PKE45_13275 [Caldilineaceae bacterium]|nr:hypothetical protein [Caldilineaceae bacterium]